MNYKKITVIFCLIGLVVLIFLNWSRHSYGTKLQIKNIETEKVNDFLVKIAKTDAEKERGLMWVDSLPQDQGMMFEFENERIILMWMKNTKISLDMIFINKEGRVVGVKQNAKPESLDIISSEILALKVLEINGGLAKKLNIKIGDSVTY